MPMTDPIDVVAAVIRDRDLVMVARRRTGDLAGKWEFPGGKVQPGEPPSDALRREIMEEFRVSIEIGAIIHVVPFFINTTRYRLTAFFAKHKKGIYRLQEHTSMEWVRPEDLLSTDLAPADIPIARAVIRMLS